MGSGSLRGALVATLCVALLGAAWCPAQDLTFPAEQHPWGAFPVGSWKKVRVVSESLDAMGNVTEATTTETKTTLSAADDTSYTLQTETSLEISGKRFPRQLNTVKHGYLGEEPGQMVSLKRIGEAEITIDARTIPCEIREMTVETPGSRWHNKLYYSSTVAPYVLRRESSLEAGDGAEKIRETVVETVALQVPERLFEQVHDAHYLKTIQKQNGGTKVTLEVHCPEVPGGVVRHGATETDDKGVITRRSTLELLDYEVPQPAKDAPVTSRRRIFHRKASRRMEER